jgi:hypothetical protein
MDAPTLEVVLKAQCRQLHLPSVSARCMSLEQEAVRAGQRHSQYLSALLEQELAYYGEKDRSFRFRRTTRFGRNGPGPERSDATTLCSCQEAGRWWPGPLLAKPTPPPWLW